VPLFGFRQKKAYKEAKKAEIKAQILARQMEEEKGIICDPKKQLVMELQRNSGIGRNRAHRIIMHLEMHKRGIGPPVDHHFRKRLSDLITQVKQEI
jgi:3-methyladenine DNA glycosylase/8-oxoguanine DNA glycosylase